MFVLIIRTIILYFFTLVIIRLTGKRQLGQLQPFELVITVMISQLATDPMQDIRIPLIHVIGPIVTLLLLQVLTMFLSLKNEFARKVISGKPSVIVEQGKIQIKEMKYQNININDLLEELRLKGFYNIEDIEYAILETSGELSIIPTTSKTSITKSDLNIRSTQDKLPVTLILDGKINYNNLKIINKDIHWLEEQLIRNKISDYRNIFFAICDSNGKFFFQLHS